MLARRKVRTFITAAIREISQVNREAADMIARSIADAEVLRCYSAA